MEMIQDNHFPLVFILGTKPISDYLVKGYEESSYAKKYPINFQNYQLETKFSHFVKANTPAKVPGIKGLFNITWLKRVKLLIPSVVVAVFDWSNEDPAINKLHWAHYEHTLQERYRELQSDTSLYGSALIVIVLISLKILGPNTMDEVQANFKKNMNVNTSYFYVLFKGIDAFAPNMKKFTKSLSERSGEFYRMHRKKIKSKLSLREKMPTSQHLTIKPSFKLAFLYEFVRNLEHANRCYKSCYHALTQNLSIIRKSYDIWEVRAFADNIVLKLMKFCIQKNEAKQVLWLFEDHYSTFKLQPQEIDPRFGYLEFKWRATQLKRFAHLLQNNILASDPITKSKEVSTWLSFLNFASAKILIKERDFMEKNNLVWSPERKKYEIPFDIKELNSYEFLDSIYIGKEKLCSPKEAGVKLEPGKAAELVQKNKFLREYNPELSHEIVALLRATLQNNVATRMKSYLEYYILKEYRRLGKHADYRTLKKKLLDTLNENKWVSLSGRLLEEDGDFVAEDLESSDLATEIQLDELSMSKENPLNKAEKLQKLIERILKIPNIPNKIQYRLKEEKNNLLRIFGYYDKNPVGTHDFTTLHLTVVPMVAFPIPVQYLLLNFSDESLSKLVYLTKDQKAPATADQAPILNPNESRSFEVVIYIKPGSYSFITLRSISVVMKLKNDMSDTSFCIDVLPYLNTISLLPDAMKSADPLRLNVVKTERVIDIALQHNQPAFLGEKYSFSMLLKPYPTYEITNIQAIFSEVAEVEKPASGEKRVLHAPRKASVLSDSGSSETGDNWRFVLYAPSSVKASSEKEPEGAPPKKQFEKQSQNHFSLSSIGAGETLVPLYFQFREEGQKSFELLLRYTAKKKLNDVITASEFIMENKESFSINVVCPFRVSTEWLLLDPCINCTNAQSAAESSDKTKIGVNKRATLGVRIDPSGYQDVAVHSVSLKTKEDKRVKLVSVVPGDITSLSPGPAGPAGLSGSSGLEGDNKKPTEGGKEEEKKSSWPVERVQSSWKKWPIVLGKGEIFEGVFTLLPSQQYLDEQVADIEIEWTRVNADNPDRTICSIPLCKTTATEMPLEIMISPPIKAFKQKEFFVNVSLKNKTPTIIEIEVIVEDSQYFMISGEISTRIILPPYESDSLVYGLVPLVCGKLDLPKFIVLMKAQQESVPILDRSQDLSIYVFPA